MKYSRTHAGLIVISLSLFIAIAFAADAGAQRKSSPLELLQRLGEVAAKRTREKPAAQIFKTTEMVEMRDGTRLATDIYRLPFGDSATVLLRTPYGRDGSEMETLGNALVLAGFSSVIQDTRGRYDSEGENLAFMSDGWGLNTLLEGQTAEHWDGYDTVEWISEQSWNDGNIGMLGVSALGIAANLAAGAYAEFYPQPSKLKCMAVLVAAQDIYHDAAHQGGGYRKSLVEGWLSDVEAESVVLDEIVENESYNALWQEIALEPKYPGIEVPVYHVGGWYDIFLQGTLDFFSGLQRQGAPGATGQQKVIIGPWTHEGIGQQEQGDLTYPEDAAIYDEELDNIIDWFNYWLKSDDNGIDDLPSVRYYLMGDVDSAESAGNRWISGEQWPPSATESGMHLWPGGGLKGYPLETDSGQDTFTYNPDAPVPTVGGPNLNLPAGPKDQSSIELREDVLVYTSDVLSEPLVVAGPIRAILHASSSAVDTDWTVRLCDVYPDGRSMLVTDGILRARYRDGFEQAELMTPGEVYEFEIDLWSTAIAFDPGHRIRVSISSSNSPRFDPNPNTGAPLGQSAETIVAENAIHFSAQYPSRLLLPVTSPAHHPLFQKRDSAVIYAY